MRTTLDIDDDLYTEAVELTGIQEKTALLREALKALIECEIARRFVRLGGSLPQFDEAAEKNQAL